MEKKGKLSIAICDDQMDIHMVMETHIRQYEREYDIYCEVHSFFSGAELLECKENMDILFLDMSMPGMDGIETARKLKKNQFFRMAVLAEGTERFQEAFKIGAFRYVTKPIIPEELFEVLDAVREKVYDNKTVKVYLKGIDYQILERDIIYLMADNDYVRIFTQKGDYTSPLSLKKWSEILDEDHFFIAHRAYIVNLNKIIKMEKQYIFLETQEKIPIARRRHTELLRKRIVLGLEV